MRLNHKLLAVLSALFLAFITLPCPVFAGDIKPVGDQNGEPPRTVLVEQPQEALKSWGEGMVSHRTLLLISEGLGISAISKEDTARVAGLVGKDGWDEVLEKPYPTPKFYPVNPFDYIYAAHMAGMIDKIYWVPPTKTSVGAEPIDSFRDFLKSLSVSEGDLARLKQSKDSIQGTINGIPLYICRLEDLPVIKEEVVAGIDLSYFTSLYTEEVKTPMLDQFGGFIKTLGSKGIKVSHVVISRSTGMGQVPLEYRFLGGYLYTYFTDPRSLENGPLQQWDLRAQAMYQETFFQAEEVLDYYKKAVEVAPDDASLRYSLAVAYFNMNNGDKMKAELDKAVSLDKGYCTAYVEFGTYFTSKGYKEAAGDFLKEAVKTNPEDPRVWDALYGYYKASGMYDDAARTIEKIIAMGYDWPEKLGQLGEAYEKQGLHEKAVNAYTKALSKIPQVDRQSRFSLLLGLAKAYEEGRKIDDALKTYSEAVEATDDQHVKDRIRENNIEGLKRRWAPFVSPIGK